ncbi:MAG: hypothetical protein ACFB8W_12155 [Elainellaceae cyanobacterium]
MAHPVSPVEQQTVPPPVPSEVIQVQSRQQKQRRASWWSKVTALIALINLLLVGFDLSYLHLRDVYLHYAPGLTALYDPVKHVQVHPTTQSYLQAVERLDQEIETVGIRAPAIAPILTDLQQQSEALVDENPFAGSGQFGTFATFKQRMRQHMGTASTKEAFQIFWSLDYLEQAGWQPAVAFFQQDLAPLLQRNYYRPITATGQYEDGFWRLDIAFIAFFFLDYLIRTWIISRTQAHPSWAAAMLRRWYDLFLLIPFWRWLRAIPVTTRLHQSGLLNLERVLSELTHEPAAYLADRVSTFALVRLINQTRSSVNEGALARALLGASGEYVQIGHPDKVDAIVDRLLDLAVYKALPQIQPDLEALLRHSLRRAVAGSDFFQSLQRLPGISSIPEETTETFADYLAQASYEVLVSSYGDLEGRVLLDQLSGNFREALLQELRDRATQQEIERLLADILEEIKVNYVQQSVQHDPEATLEEADQLYQTSEESLDKAEKNP